PDSLAQDPNSNWAALMQREQNLQPVADAMRSSNPAMLQTLLPGQNAFDAGLINRAYGSQLQNTGNAWKGLSDYFSKVNEASASDAAQAKARPTEGPWTDWSKQAAPPPHSGQDYAKQHEAYLKAIEDLRNKGVPIPVDQGTAPSQTIPKENNPPVRGGT